MTKRIINGKTYNTETATLLAAETPRGPYRAEFDELYQTRHGAYFRHHGDWSVANEDGPEAYIEPLTPPEAQSWMEKHATASLIEKHFGEQPEAGEAESRFTFRMPDTLKNRIEAVALANGQSLNAWLIRCVESCVTCQADVTAKRG